ncbi:DUF1287 domain-containing protein [Myxococcota bacterium]|nr:DUF1287 domain-containing protein [Myxococcota bacterium]MBU1537304.1 DUF1287 domain-containing protein [Myxococcota bacterium]
MKNHTLLCPGVIALMISCAAPVEKRPSKPPVKQRPPTKPPAPVAPKAKPAPVVKKLTPAAPVEEPWPHLMDKGVFSDFDKLSTPRLWWGCTPGKTSFTVRTGPKVLTILQGKVPVKSYRYKSTVTFIPGSYGSGKASGAAILFKSPSGRSIAVVTGSARAAPPGAGALILSTKDFAELKRFLLRPLEVLTAARAKKNDLDKDGIPDQVDTLMGAIKLTQNHASYDASYFSMGYPKGDPPKGKGVCTDVVIRAMRNAGADLQVLIHRDIVRNRSRYRYIKTIDRAIDHRRVRSMLPYFKTHCRLLHRSISKETAREFLPGDIVLMDVTTFWPGADHVGVVSDEKGPSGYPMIIHNLGNTKYEDLFPSTPMLYHFRCNYRYL